MTKDKKVLYITSISIFAVLFATFFINERYTKLITACLTVALALVVHFAIKKRGAKSINKREVLLLVTILAALYVILFHMSGLYFGFYKNPYFITSELFLLTVLPTTAIIIATEAIRSILLVQNNALASVFAFLSCLMAEVLMTSSLAGIVTFNNFMDMVGLTLFPVTIANIFYHYTSRRFGALPNIAFRLITTLYVYFVPTVTAMPNALQSCIKIFLPIIILALVCALFEKKKRNAIQKGKKLSTVGIILSIMILSSNAMLISCQFRFGAIVVATESMTGEINKGDMIIYEKYDAQSIKEGQVIVFLQNENKIIHRVVRIENISGEVRYYTKGDANDSEDFGYRIDSDIVGLTDMKVAYVGFPTLWLRELLEGSN